jgi:asparagine synthase (glutamine-hydrolysing)
MAYSRPVCGFVGIASPRQQRVVHGEEIAAMLATIAYRGPDDEATDLRSGFAVGFRRLSIVDVEHGRQPMWTEDGALGLVCNGEIYNHEELREALESRGHRLRTRSDSEVLLHGYREWGAGVVERLRGIFAFAIWDEPRRTLFLGRDRSGVKPLFVRAHDDELFFASEAKALLAHPTTPRRLDLLGCFAPPVPDDVLEPSPFEGISQLGAGCSLTFTSAGDLRPARYWTYEPVADDGPDDDGAEEIARFREELLRVVPMQLMADVPVGAYLSGGLDSSVVATLAGSHQPGLPTFTSACAGSEDPWFTYVLSRVSGLRDTHFVRFAPEDLLDELPRVAWAAEGAFDLGFLGRHQLAVAASRLGLKVLLSGQGADELMGGYPMSYAALAASARREACAERLLHSGWPSLASWLRDSGEAGGRDLVLDLKRGHAALSHYLLRFEDRMGMLAGVEVRVPFLDHRLVEICAGIPGARRRRLLGDKRLLREAALGIVHDGVRLRPKFAFNGNLPPITQLLASAGRQTAASELLTDRAVQDRAYFDPRQVERLRRAHNYQALDSVLIVHMLDELFVTRFDPASFVGVEVPAPEITVDASWMPVQTVLMLARKGPSSGDTPSVRADVTRFGLLHDAQGSPGRAEEAAVLALHRNDGECVLVTVPDGVDAALMIGLLRAADGTRTYAELAASLGAGVDVVLAIGRLLTDERVLEHGSRGGVGGSGSGPGI